MTRYGYGFLLVSLTTSASADGLFSLKVENDSLSAGGDGHYTNGIEGIWAFEPADGHWTRRFAVALSGWSACSLNGVAYRFGQQMYPPTTSRSKRCSRTIAPMLACCTAASRC